MMSTAHTSYQVSLAAITRRHHRPPSDNPGIPARLSQAGSQRYLVRDPSSSMAAMLRQDNLGVPVIRYQTLAF